MFWGIAFVVAGLSIIVNHVFGINIPFFKILFGCLLIYWGLSFIFGSFNMKFKVGKTSTSNEAVFAESQFQYGSDSDSQNDFKTVFGESQLDLSGVEVKSGQPQEIRLSTVFGDSKIYVKKGQPISVSTKTVFGSARLPNKDVSAFGQFNYLTPGFTETDVAFAIKADIVFGNLEVIEK